MSQFGLGTFYVLSSHMCLVTTILDSTDLYCFLHKVPFNAPEIYIVQQNHP